MWIQYVHRSCQDGNLCSYTALKYTLPEITCPLSDTLINSRQIFQNTITLPKHDHIGNLVFHGSKHQAYISIQTMVTLLFEIMNVSNIHLHHLIQEWILLTSSDALLLLELTVTAEGHEVTQCQNKQMKYRETTF